MFRTTALMAVLLGGLTACSNDSTAHTSTADGGLWSSGVISIHPNMVGTITVQ